MLSADDVERLDAEAMEKVDEAVDFAERSPFPDLASLYDDIYVIGDQVRDPWWSTDSRSPDVHRGEQEREAGDVAQRARGGGRRPRRRRDRPRHPGRAGARRGELTMAAEQDGGMADHALPRGAQPGAARGDARRRAGLPDGRGRRRLPGRVQGDRRPARGVRRAARARHADLREHDRRDGRRRGDGRAAADRRADDDQLLAARARPDRQQRRFDPLHVRRPGQGAAGDPDAAGRRPPARADALALLRGALPARPRPAGRRADDAGRRARPAEGGDPRRQPGDLHRARDALRPPRRGARRAGAAALRRGRGAPRGRRRDDRRHLADGRDGAEGRRHAGVRARASRPR